MLFAAAGWRSMSKAGAARNVPPAASGGEARDIVAWRASSAR